MICFPLQIHIIFIDINVIYIPATYFIIRLQWNSVQMNPCISLKYKIIYDKYILLGLNVCNFKMLKLTL